MRGPGLPPDREKLLKFTLLVGIRPFSGALRVGQTRTNAAIFGCRGERRAKTRLAAGGERIRTAGLIRLKVPPQHLGIVGALDGIE
jgi:hypothetical protein